MDEEQKNFNQLKTKSLKVGINKIYDQSAEILKLKEELRIKDSEIERLSLKLTAFQSYPGKVDYQGIDENFDCTYHLAFTFSSPLVRRINSTVGIISQLDYINEIRNIEKHLKGVNQEIRYKVEVATISNFRSVIADAPFALHFTGHGIKNDKSALGSTYLQFKDKGDILLLEDDNGMADYLFQEDLK